MSFAPVRGMLEKAIVAEGQRLPIEAAPTLRPNLRAAALVRYVDGQRVHEQGRSMATFSPLCVGPAMFNDHLGPWSAQPHPSIDPVMLDYNSP
jgi:hypothetical protein